MDFRAALDSDFARLVEVSSGNLDRPVPTCPGWTVDDLDRHVAAVYLHKVACIRDKAEPVDWPPAELAQEDTQAQLHRAYLELTAELAVRADDEPAGNWYAPDPTVGFWRRRMAQETVIHRIDAELAAAVPSVDVPDDLALDGIDEVLRIFLEYSVGAWHDYFVAGLTGTDGRSVAMAAGGRRWLVAIGPDTLAVSEGDAPAAAEVTGTPDALLRWLWRRADDATVTATGDAALVAKLRDLLGTATQ
ncbi:maleylpyruvate isomerase family mycothiol-dependent enzyme [Catellatospora sichuanensis]|uniref:maleylpyruvate isomerase family mycothiol-dependent enzyme n=1 Tax=Catellatospora sichuanensis TaxID=1969805 RepID=UPI0016426802|nr:maleylpyruvate isomerase family mycothiol-dependent enzyme [Catellatospora sichuanensis]